MRMRAMARLRARLDDERGLTLVELVVATSILGIVMLVFTTTLMSMQKAVVSQDVHERLADQARLALQSIDRQVRSGNLLYNPSSEAGNDPYSSTATGYLIRIYTQARYSSSDNSRCVLWMIDDQQRLLTRYWTPLDPSSASEWQIVATGIVNRSLGVSAFSLDSTGRTLNVVFKVNPSLSSSSSSTQTFQASLTGRNTSFGYPNDVCADLPSGMTPSF